MLGFLAEAGFVLWLAALACFALALLIVAMVLFSQGVVCRVRLDDRQLFVEQLRFGKVRKRQHLLLAEVASVDYTHQLNASGAGLSLRREALDDTMATLEGADNPKAAFTAALQLMQGVAAGVQLPCSRLSLASKVALDILLSREVARRSGRVPSEL